MANRYIPHLEVGSNKDKALNVFSEYAHSITDVFDTEFSNLENNTNVHLQGYLLGNTLLSKAHMSAGGFYYSRDERKIASTGLDLILVQIMLEGGDIRNANGENIKTQKGDVCFSDLTRGFSSFAQYCTNFSFLIPRSGLNLTHNEIDSLHGLILPNHTSSANLISSHTNYIWEQSKNLNLHEANALSNVAIDLISALAMPHLKYNEDNAAVNSAQIIQIRRFIDENLANQALRPELLCHKFNMSRATLYRLFEPLGGVSDYIRARRLAKSLKYISQPLEHQKTLGVIALDCGFSDLNIFSRAFKTYFGISPSDAREFIYIQKSNTQNMFDEDSFSKWIRDINITY